MTTHTTDTTDTTHTSPTTAPPAGGDRPTSWRPALAAAVIAGVVNVLIHALATAADVSFRVSFGPDEDPFHIDPATVGLSTAVPIVAATLLVALAMRWSVKVLRPAQVLAGAVALLSVGGPLALTADTGAVVALSAMHLVAGLAVIAALEAARQPR